MKLSKRKLIIFTSLLTGIFVILAVLTACNTPFGFGEAIDWEPPVLTLDPEFTNPLFVRTGTTLRGTATDNVKVDRVILRDAITGKEMFRATLLPNDRWEMPLLFTADDNGEKIPVEIVAYDRADNSGDMSIAAISLIIDIQPPIVEDQWIQRSPTRTADLANLFVLEELEQPLTYTSVDINRDPYGEKSAFVDMYQNGWFNIAAKIGEEETRVEAKTLKLLIFDKQDRDRPLLELSINEDSSVYSPRWLVKEEDLLSAGNSRFGASYATDYYDNGKRYYYFVEVVAFDSSQNRNLVDDIGWFCMWERGDLPKGIYDSAVMGDQVPKGTPLPIEFFDDDEILTAYGGIIRKATWETNVAPHSNQPGGIQQWMINNISTVLTWDGANDQVIEDFTPRITGLKESNQIIQTTNSEFANGEYVLFTLVQDNKVDPHPAGGTPETTMGSRWNLKYDPLFIIDENEPLIVFDTANTEGNPVTTGLGPNAGSPKENTFPVLYSDGRYFYIHGYTLRACTAGSINGVYKFRMAYMPYFTDDGETQLTSKVTIEDVQNALYRLDDTSPFKAPSEIDPVEYPSAQAFMDNYNIQFWELINVTGNLGTLTSGELINIAGGTFRKQYFQKKFDILGGQDDEKSAYDNFTRKKNQSATFENQDKQFVFYAEDNMGHDVYRAIRLLPQVIPPELKVFVLTGLQPNTNPPSGIPDRLDDKYYNPSGNFDADGRQNYDGDLKTYNQDPAVYNYLKGYAMPGGNIIGDTNLVPESGFQLYPRGTVVKYWATAQKGGSVDIASIELNDIMYGFGLKQTAAQEADKSLSYIESFPEVENRDLVFTAKDKLGNEKTVRISLTIVPSAFLNNITTTNLPGTYGIGKTITLRANFTGLVRWTGTNAPMLNVQYTRNGTVQTRQIATKTPANQQTLFLEFEYTVQEGDNSDLVTLYSGFPGVTNPNYLRPIYLPPGTQILDQQRGTTAFIPGAGIDEWTTDDNSLQKYAKISLDGIRPKINGFSIGQAAVGGKAPWQATGPTIYSYKEGDSIVFLLTSDKEIQKAPVGANENPRIQFTVGGTNYYADWQRSSGSNGMLFSYTVTNTTGEGQIQNGTTSIILNTAQGNIVSASGNQIDVSGATYLPTTTQLWVDTTPPNIPPTFLDNGNVQIDPGDVTYYLETGKSPYLYLNFDSVTTGENHPVTVQYSFDNGLTWLDYGTSPKLIPGGLNYLRTRYVDKAGNEGPEFFRPVFINNVFPKLLSITADKPNGFYREVDTITFTLAFDDDIWINRNDETFLNMVLYDRNKASNSGTYNDQDAIRLTTGAAIPETNPQKTIDFVWKISDTGSKELRNGMFVQSLTLTGLQDRFHNEGGTVTGVGTQALGYPLTISGQTGVSDNLNGADLKVDCVAPSINADGYNPINGQVSVNRTSVTLTFREPVKKGSGTITVRPRYDGTTTERYYIPAVLENEGYYLDTATGSRSPNYQGGYTWVAGFSDIYNELSTANKAYLTQGASLSDLTLNDRTGHSAGPYKKMSHGLKDGNGYSGNFSGNAVPNNNQASMVPDTTIKWVLDYQYQITATDNTVENIRTALNAAKFRWQEIDVTSVTIAGNLNAQVTINFNQPLEEGLQWQLSFDGAAFTDEAGNNSTGLAAGDYWFWSNGVQTPVIRVNRRSFDARNTTIANPAQGSFSNINDTSGGKRAGRAYAVPADTTGWDTDTIAINDNNGWGIGDFNTVHYRIESETPGATIYYRTHLGSTDNDNNNQAINGTGAAGKGSITALFTGNAGGTATWDFSETNSGTASAGTWVQNNLIRRVSGTRGNTPAQATYQVIENGDTITRTMASYSGFRSYNRDITSAILVGGTADITTNSSTNGVQARFTYADRQASKNYVAAQAQLTSRVGTGGAIQTVSGKGFEGVFRTVVALNQYAIHYTAANNNNYLVVEGATTQNGPPVAGFPVRDAAESSDNRFLKLYYYVGAGSTANSYCYYWVSTEIVSSWFMQKYGGYVTGATHQQYGDNAGFLTAGYGDLSYGWRIRSYNENN